MPNDSSRAWANRLLANAQERRQESIHLSNEDLLTFLLDAYRGLQVLDPTTRENYCQLYRLYRHEVLNRMVEPEPVKVTARCHWCEKSFEKSKGVGAAMNFCSSACLTTFRKTYTY